MTADKRTVSVRTATGMAKESRVTAELLAAASVLIIVYSVYLAFQGIAWWAHILNGLSIIFWATACVRGKRQSWALSKIIMAEELSRR